MRLYVPTVKIYGSSVKKYATTEMKECYKLNTTSKLGENIWIIVESS
jgi:hypothetical protein